MKEPWSEILGIDLRSMALFRLGLGAFILLDLVSRAVDLSAHYTWTGVVSAGTMNADHGRLIFLTPHYYCASSTLLQAGLFAIHGLLAVGLFLGVRTRAATVACWFLACSLQMCNQALWYAADDVLRLCLFWGMFLPLGARFSIDSAAARPPRHGPDVYVSAATVACLVQICLIYLAASIFKLQSPYWVAGDAVRYALHFDWYVTDLGIWIRQQAWLVPWLTWGTIALEGLVPVLVFSPVWHGPLRMIVVALLAGMHVGFILTMAILLFPYASLVCLFPLIPTWFWDRLFRRLRSKARFELRIHYDGDCSFCQRMTRLIRTIFLLPETRLAAVTAGTEEESLVRQAGSWVVVDAGGVRHTHFDAFLTVLRGSPWASWASWALRLSPLRTIGDWVYRWVAAHRSQLGFLSEPLSERPLRVRPWILTQVFVVVALALVMGQALRTFKIDLLPAAADRVSRVLRLGPQNWSMFRFGERVADSWVVMPARLADGAVVDLFRGGSPVDWEKPQRVAAIYPSDRWMQYLHHKPRWGMYAQYAEHHWNDRHGPKQQIVGLEIYAMVEVTHADHVGKPARTLQHRMGESVWPRR